MIRCTVESHSPWLVDGFTVHDYISLGHKWMLSLGSWKSLVAAAACARCVVRKNSLPRVHAFVMSGGRQSMHPLCIANSLGREHWACGVQSHPLFVRYAFLSDSTPRVDSLPVQVEVLSGREWMRSLCNPRLLATSFRPSQWGVERRSLCGVMSLATHCLCGARSLVVVRQYVSSILYFITGLNV